MCLALLFPGQGSQHVGMGRSLADAYPEAARVFEEADDVLGFSISKLAWEGPEDHLVLTKNAQPAMLVHSPRRPSTLIMLPLVSAARIVST